MYEVRKERWMLEDGDVVKVTLNQTLLGEEVKNIFWFIYTVVIIGAELLDLLDDFGVFQITPMAALQASELFITDVVAENMTNGIDIETLPLGVSGTDTGSGAPMPSYVSAGFKFNVGNKSTRPGGKRVGGIGENRGSDNAYVPDTTTATDAALGFETPMVVTGAPIGSGIATPVIVGRDPLGDLELSRINPVSSVDWVSTIRSQVSRRS